MSPRATESELSSPGAIKLGLIFATFGQFPLLRAAGVIPTGPADAPTLLFFCLGALLVVGGIVLILSGADEADRYKFASGPGFAIRMVQSAIVLAIVVLLANIMSGEAFASAPPIDNSLVINLARPIPSTSIPDIG